MAFSSRRWSADGTRQQAWPRTLHHHTARPWLVQPRHRLRRGRGRGRGRGRRYQRCWRRHRRRQRAVQAQAQQARMQAQAPARKHDHGHRTTARTSDRSVSHGSVTLGGGWLQDREKGRPARHAHGVQEERLQSAGLCTHAHTRTRARPPEHSDALAAVVQHVVSSALLVASCCLLHCFFFWLLVCRSLCLSLRRRPRAPPVPCGWALPAHLRVASARRLGSPSAPDVRACVPGCRGCLARPGRLAFSFVLAVAAAPFLETV